MRVKAIYRKNLKMSEGKIAAQVAHAIVGLSCETIQVTPLITIIVLGVSDKKFFELSTTSDCYIHYDLGYTEVDAGEPTAVAWWEEG